MGIRTTRIIKRVTKIIDNYLHLSPLGFWKGPTPKLEEVIVITTIMAGIRNIRVS